MAMRGKAELFIDLSPHNHFSWWMPVRSISWKVLKRLKWNLVY